MVRIWVFGLFMLTLHWACSTVPITERKRVNIVDDADILPASFAQYDTFLKENKISSDVTKTKEVRTVGRNIADAVDRFMRANGMIEEADNYRWEFNLVEDQQMNAWCLPGGKVVFYTGILPICEGETGIAVVMGHEVAHALADHGAQRMSAQTLQAIGMVAGNVAIQDEEDRLLFNTAYGVGSTVGGTLPFSRSHETEADRIGVQIMAIAGYYPAAAPELWKRMKANKNGGTPEMLSTHPSDDRRIANLTQWVPEAKKEAGKFGVTSFQ